MTLVEIPNNSEINDNIVAYWQPESPILAGTRIHLSPIACPGATTRRCRPARSTSPTPGAVAATSTMPRRSAVSSSTTASSAAARSDQSRLQAEGRGERRSGRRRARRTQSGDRRLADHLQSRSRRAPTSSNSGFRRCATTAAPPRPGCTDGRPDPTRGRAAAGAGLRRRACRRSRRRRCRRNASTPMRPQPTRPFVDPEAVPLALRAAAWPCSAARRSLTGVAVYEMWQALRVSSLTPIEAVVLVLFALNLGWIALAFTSAVAGFLVLVAPALDRQASGFAGRGRRPHRGADADLQRARRTGSLPRSRRWRRASRARARAGAFDWFVLSDTTDPEIALAEDAALRRAPRPALRRSRRVYYRRRRRNVGAQGRQYRRLLPALGRRLRLSPDARRRQPDRAGDDHRARPPDRGRSRRRPHPDRSAPGQRRAPFSPACSSSPAASTARSSPPGSPGGASREGNYWGHNAIIRASAFTGAAGLPLLPGKPPFGGHILSHDFVEAALIRRAGWTVRIADDLDGSLTRRGRPRSSISPSATGAGARATCSMPGWYRRAASTGSAASISSRASSPTSRRSSGFS